MPLRDFRRPGVYLGYTKILNLTFIKILFPVADERRGSEHNFLLPWQTFVSDTCAFIIIHASQEYVIISVLLKAASQGPAPPVRALRDPLARDL